jgi:hypothetical protein
MGSLILFGISEEGDAMAKIQLGCVISTSLTKYLKRGSMTFLRGLVH